MASRRYRGTRRSVAIVLLACLSGPLCAQSHRFSGEVALASQLVDQGLPITPVTPVLQGSISWMSPDGWSAGIAGGVEVRSPGRPVVVLARVSRHWALSDDWMAQAGVHYYDYRAAGSGGIPDRADASLYFTYRDILVIGVSAVRVSGDRGERLLGAAHVDASYPLARQVSVTAGAGVAEAAVGSGHRGGYHHDYRGRDDRIRIYRYGSLGLAWSDGRMRLQLDRHFNSLGTRRAYGTQASVDWVATASWAF